MDPATTYKFIKSGAQAMRYDMRAWRHHLHQYPELSFKEEETTRFVSERLREFGFTDIQEGFGPLKTGVMASVGKGRPCVCLRANLDALPITEQTGLPYASKNEGVMHACGHDVQVATLLGAAKLLKCIEPAITGRVKFLFQPGEEKRQRYMDELLPGAGFVLLSGAVNDVDALFAMHAWGTFEKGRIYVRSGPAMMASSRFMIKVIGQGTHGAYPHMGHDPVITACQIVEALQTIISREMNPSAPGLITVATIHGGRTYNVTPQEVEITGLIRAPDSDLLNWLGERVETVAQKTAEAHLCTAECHVLVNGPAVINDPAMTSVVREAAAQIVGPERISDIGQLTSSEDFREYSSRKPAALYFMGMRDELQGFGQPQHSPYYRVPDDILPDSAAVMASIAVRCLEKLAKKKQPDGGRQSE